MRFLATILFLLGSLICYCQSKAPSGDSPINWELSENGIKATIQKGWHLYAEKDTGIGIEGVSINDQPITAGNTIIIEDPLFDNKQVRVYKNSALFGGPTPHTNKIIIRAYAANGEEFLPIEETIELAQAKSSKLSTIDLDNPGADCGEKISTTGSSLWNIFLKGFAGGLIALLMPCIFPMLPVTVSFFMNRSLVPRDDKGASRRRGVRNGFLYGGFIFGIYLLASIPFHIVGNVNPQIFNIISTNAWVNILFFLVFVLFALSLFGLFELKLPGSLASVAGKKSSASSIGGIFFMALTLAVVSFSCTGPILGFLLVNSINANNGAWALTAGMAGFGVALALPFGLFAMFPQWMKKLPRSGGWMEKLKISLGFVELALAFKFLSNADMVEHWGILKREVFIWIWLLLSLALAVYLLRDSRKSFLRRYLGYAVLMFSVYLGLGLTNSNFARLELLSGFPPPLSYSLNAKNSVAGVEADVVNDYDKAIALSKKTGKPLLVDFTGWACVNCRKMEENVWSREEVSKLIREKFVLVSLYVDDREKLPGGGTVGEKWAGFQTENFKSASQPQYVILSPEEKLLNNPVGYSSVDDYKEWLKCGLNSWNKN